jgi:hypothetical protein
MVCHASSTADSWCKGVRRSAAISSPASPERISSSRISPRLSQVRRPARPRDSSWVALGARACCFLVLQGRRSGGSLRLGWEEVPSDSVRRRILKRNLQEHRSIAPFRRIGHDPLASRTQEPASYSHRVLLHFGRCFRPEHVHQALPRLAAIFRVHAPVGPMRPFVGTPLLPPRTGTDSRRAEAAKAREGHWRLWPKDEPSPLMG